MQRTLAIQRIGWLSRTKRVLGNGPQDGVLTILWEKGPCTIVVE